MPMRWTTLTEFLLKEEAKVPQATGHFTLLLNQLAEAGKIIASHVKKTGLVDIVGATGKKNTSQDEVQKLDKFGNDLLVDILTQSGLVYAMGSEELEKPIFPKNKTGKYIVFFDPLDGSGNINTTASMGTIFSIYKKSDDILQPGRKQVAAGYIVYGSSVMLVYTNGRGVNGFTLDPAVGSFLLSHPNIRVPTEGRTYCTNEGLSASFPESVQKYLHAIKQSSEPYRLRNIGSMTADVHRILFNGGIFFYPESVRTGRSKLRLLFEINPLSFVVTHAGGSATSNGKDPLEIKPRALHDRAPIALGSKKEIEKYSSFFKK